MVFGWGSWVCLVFLLVAKPTPTFLLVLLGFLLLSRLFGPPFVVESVPSFGLAFVGVCGFVCMWDDRGNGLLCSVNGAFLERGSS